MDLDDYQKEKYAKIDVEELFKKNQDVLPQTTSLVCPKMEYHVLADAVFWEDEGLLKIPWELSNEFRGVLNYRTSLIVSPEVSFVNPTFELAKKYFPNWIGFRKERCSYNVELADRIKRIRKVSSWKIDRFFEAADR